MENSSEKDEISKIQAVDKTNLKDSSISWLTLPKVFSCVIIVGYGAFLVYMLGTVSALNQTARGHPNLKDGVCFVPRASG
jgi:hypothetical protein